MSGINVKIPNTHFRALIKYMNMLRKKNVSKRTNIRNATILISYSMGRKTDCYPIPRLLLLTGKKNMQMHESPPSSTPCN